MMRWLAFVFGLVLLLFLQGALARVTILAPDLGPSLAVYVGLFVRRESVVKAAVVLALLRGALDLAPLGFHLLVTLALVMVVDVARGVVFRDRLATQLVLAFFAGVAFVFVQWLGVALLPGVAGSEVLDLLPLSASTLSGALLAPPAFGLLRFVRATP